MEKKEILDTSVAIERKEGIVSVFTVVEHPPSLNKFEILFPDNQDYIKAIEISNKLREKGKPMGAVDILIAAICLNREAKLITKDKDFNIIKTIFPEFKLKIN